MSISILCYYVHSFQFISVNVVPAVLISGRYECKIKKNCSPCFECTVFTIMNAISRTLKIIFNKILMKKMNCIVKNCFEFTLNWHQLKDSEKNMVSYEYVSY